MSASSDHWLQWKRNQVFLDLWWHFQVSSVSLTLWRKPATFTPSLCISKKTRESRGCDADWAGIRQSLKCCTPVNARTAGWHWNALWRAYFDRPENRMTISQHGNFDVTLGVRPGQKCTTEYQWTLSGQVRYKRWHYTILLLRWLGKNLPQCNIKLPTPPLGDCCFVQSDAAANGMTINATQEIAFLQPILE